MQDTHLDTMDPYQRDAHELSKWAKSESDDKHLHRFVGHLDLIYSSEPLRLLRALAPIKTNIQCQREHKVVDSWHASFESISQADEPVGNWGAYLHI